jgi:hypothetical protein
MVACLQPTVETCFPQLLPTALGIFCDTGEKAVEAARKQ